MKVAIGGMALPKGGALALLIPTGKWGATATSIDKRTKGALKRAIRAANFKAGKNAVLELVAPTGVSASRLILIGTGKAADLKPTDWETIGGTLVGHLERCGEKTAAIAVDTLDGEAIEPGEAAARIAFGATLRGYKFDRYKTRKGSKGDQKPSLGKLQVMAPEQAAAKRHWGTLSKIAEGVCLARDLVNEPANILYPKEFADRAKALTKLGVTVEVLGVKQMEKLGMGALLGVGQGSVRESQLVVMQWKGAAKSTDAPVAFIGKGVCFDTGGISLKPPAGMEDMKGDMGGAACVTGLMHALAARKARVNAVGVIGLVENMPDANAQRPGDIVTSMSGQTIEVINTDAEGRLVLADALWYTQDRFKPKFMIDLATLTGAIMIALGKEYAGLFSNNDELSARLSQVGEIEQEKVWRLPMGEAYDKLIDSRFADMKNTGGRDGGSITAAQFLQRFVNNVPWAHLDIAGTAMASPSSAINTSWGSGYGVRLLNRLVADHYEGK